LRSKPASPTSSPPPTSAACCISARRRMCPYATGSKCSKAGCVPMPEPIRDATPRRAGYPYFLAIPTRWMDNDNYGHVNNVVYLSYFDTLVNEHLIRTAGLDIRDGPAIGLVAETGCRFHKALSFPEVIDAGLRVTKLGNSSVHYEIALFRQQD